MKRIIFLSALLFIFASISSFCWADDIKGKIDTININDNSFEISGVRVFVQGAAIENQGGMVIDISGLKAGDYVDVDGFLSGPGLMTALLVQKDVWLYDELKGRVEQIDPSGEGFYINGIKVKILPSTHILDSQNVEVKLGQIQSYSYADCKGRWTANREFTADTIGVQ